LRALVGDSLRCIAGIRSNAVAARYEANSGPSQALLADH
jgi:hypothetical protein